MIIIFNSYLQKFVICSHLKDNCVFEIFDLGHHASGGPVTIHRPRYQSELKEAVYRATTILGYKLGDLDAKSQTGTKITTSFD